MKNDEEKFVDSRLDSLRNPNRAIDAAHTVTSIIQRHQEDAAHEWKDDRIELWIGSSHLSPHARRRRKEDRRQLRDHD